MVPKLWNAFRKRSNVFLRGLRTNLADENPRRCGLREAPLAGLAHGALCITVDRNYWAGPVSLADTYFRGAWCFAPKTCEAPMLGSYKRMRRRVASSINRDSSDQSARARHSPCKSGWPLLIKRSITAISRRQRAIHAATCRRC